MFCRDLCNYTIRTDGQKREFWQAPLRLQNVSRAGRCEGQVGIESGRPVPYERECQLHALDYCFSTDLEI